MAVPRWLAAVLIALALGGCETFMKNDPIMGDHPWQPGGAAPPKFQSSSP